MIDEEEEDVDKLLKRKISWKAILKGVLGLMLVAGAFYLIQLSQSQENSTYLILGITLMCMASSIMVPIPQRKKDVHHTVSILRCPSCGAERVQDYKEGDFVYKVTNIVCDKCKEKYSIFEVYSIKLKSKGKKKTN